MIGLKRGTIRLCEHQAEWDEEANRTIKILKQLLGDADDDVQHVGSTSIPSIKAKPIIDIAVATKDFDKILDVKDKLHKNGFYYLGHHDDLGEQLLFASGSFYDGTGDVQTHFIHVVKTDSMDFINYINFRDYLIKNYAAAKKYEELKTSLAEDFANEEAGRKKYLEGKRDFINYTLRKALVDSYLGKTVKIKIDRPIGSVHPKHADIAYPINYGYIPGVLGGDGEELDVYLLGVSEPVKEYSADIIGIVHRKNDVEDKLVAAPKGIAYTAREIRKLVEFQEQYYDDVVETKEGRDI